MNLLIVAFLSALSRQSLLYRIVIVYKSIKSQTKWGLKDKILLFSRGFEEKEQNKSKEKQINTKARG